MTIEDLAAYWPKVLAAHRVCMEKGVYMRSLKVAAVVGTILNLIQQLPLEEEKILLTYLVPFLVATYGAVAAAGKKPAAPEQEGGQ